MTHKTFKSLIVAFVMLISAASAYAELKLPAIISDHMVVQQYMPVKIWGWAAPGAAVSVKLNTAVATATADSDGKWVATLAPQPTGEGRLVVTSGDESIAVQDVLIGEVWLASGQSNMAWPVEWLASKDQEIPQANYPQIRMFKVARASIAEGPVEDCKGEWKICTPENVGKFSAVGYFFARELHQKLELPVGIINSSVGGTPVESWSADEMLAKHPSIEGHVGYLKRQQQQWNQEEEDAKYEKKLEDWKQKAEAAKAAGKKAPGKPRRPRSLLAGGWYPSCLYNGMIAPIIPYTIRGAIWYQGESNAGRPEAYGEIFPAMIADWRKKWDQGAFPFYFVQLANYKPANDRDNWAWIRESQTKTLELENTGMAVIIDIGDSNNIHPANKQDVGRRLARWAFAKDYGKKLEYSGPLYKSFATEGEKIRISFTHADRGLRAKGGELAEFVIAGEDKNFVPATAVIEGNTVVVSDPTGKVTEPKAVRYAWEKDPKNPNLYNAQRLPASPFRTDDWPRE